MVNIGIPENGVLHGKTALIYGGGGAVGGAVARAFAADGATVHIAGRTESRLEKVANDIREAGGTAETAVVDALDEEQVDAFVNRVAKKSKRIDISFNVISFGDVQQPLMEIDVDDFTQPITLAARTHFLTTRAAAAHMVKQRSGVVLMFGGSGPQTDPRPGRFQGGARRDGRTAPAMGPGAGKTRHQGGHHGHRRHYRNHPVAGRGPR